MGRTTSVEVRAANYHDRKTFFPFDGGNWESRLARENTEDDD